MQLLQNILKNNLVIRILNMKLNCLKNVGEDEHYCNSTHQLLSHTALKNSHPSHHFIFNYISASIITMIYLNNIKIHLIESEGAVNKHLTTDNIYRSIRKFFVFFKVSGDHCKWKCCLFIQLTVFSPQFSYL